MSALQMARDLPARFYNEGVDAARRGDALLGILKTAAAAQLSQRPEPFLVLGKLFANDGAEEHARACFAAAAERGAEVPGGWLSNPPMDGVGADVREHQPEADSSRRDVVEEPDGAMTSDDESGSPGAIEVEQALARDAIKARDHLADERWAGRRSLAVGWIWMLVGLCLGAAGLAATTLVLPARRSAEDEIARTTAPVVEQSGVGEARDRSDTARSEAAQPEQNDSAPVNEQGAPTLPPGVTIAGAPADAEPAAGTSGRPPAPGSAPVDSERSKPTSPALPRIVPASKEPYVVVAGDSLWRIAAKQLGAGRYWPTIAQANAGTVADPRRLVVGQPLILPEVAGMDASASAEGSRAAADRRVE